VPTVSGTIVTVQESRFQLALDGGGTRLFMLAHDAPVEPEQLISLQRAQSWVVVTYRRRSDLIAGEAHAIATA
jgi:mannose-1-phosphate guanylyltransferase